MTAETQPVTVTILDREYRVTCPDEERDALYASARFLSGKMKEIRDTGKVIGLERVAVMAALNITHELLQKRAEKDDYVKSVNARIQHLQHRIQEVLDRDDTKSDD
jgi:cell division protein ZapA